MCSDENAVEFWENILSLSRLSFVVFLYDRKGTICIIRKHRLGDPEWGQQCFFVSSSGFNQFEDLLTSRRRDGLCDSAEFLLISRRLETFAFKLFLAYFSSLNSMAWFRIHRSYFECSPRAISGPWKASVSKDCKSKSGGILAVCH